MQERPFGTRSGLSVAPVSMGGMRFPEDTDEAVALIRHAIDAGLRYIDTSRGYGDSEIKLGKALKNGYREKVLLSTKWSPWAMRMDASDDASEDCVRRHIEEQMERLDVEYLDFYQIWSINNYDEFKQATAPRAMLSGIKRAMKDGLVRHTGFTTHDEPESVLKYLDRVAWCEVILVTYNLLNRNYEPVLEAAKRLGIGTIVMNPVGGGKLAASSGFLMDLAREVGAESVAELAVRYVLSNPNVDTLIDGIAKRADVDDSVRFAEAGPFTKPQMRTIDKVLKNVSHAVSNFCTGCKYCMPCPQGVNIPEVMACIQDERYWGLSESARKRYQAIAAGHADACEECGVCETKCTQKLRIMEEMRYAQEHLIL